LVDLGRGLHGSPGVLQCLVYLLDELRVHYQ
jgi:hypothetical protein